MMHIKYEISFNNELPTFEAIITKLEEITNLSFDGVASAEGNWHSIHLSQFSDIEMELNEITRKVALVTPTHRFYYLEGVLLWVLKKLGGTVHQELPSWVKLSYDEIDPIQLKRIPGQPSYRERWWESVLNALYEKVL